MDLQKKPSPPPIPPSPPQSGARTPSIPQAPNSAQAKSYTTYAMIGILLTGVLLLLNFGTGFIQLLDYAEILGLGFFVKYLLASNATLLLILIAGAGGIALSMKNKWGWPLAYGAALFNIFVTLYSIIVTINTPVAWTIYNNYLQIAMFYIGFFASVGVVVILSLQPVRTLFKVDSTQKVIGFGILGFLALDIIICSFLVS